MSVHHQARGVWRADYLAATHLPVALRDSTLLTGGFGGTGPIAPLFNEHDVEEGLAGLADDLEPVVPPEISGSQWAAETQDLEPVTFLEEDDIDES